MSSSVNDKDNTPRLHPAFAPNPQKTEFRPIKEESLWKNKALSRERLIITRDPDGTVTAKRIAQGFLQRFTSLFGSKEDSGDFIVKDEKKFQHIPKDFFDLEVLKMNSLYHKRNSLKEVLKELEHDLKNAEESSASVVVPLKSAKRPVQTSDENPPEKKDQESLANQQEIPTPEATKEEIEERHRTVMSLRTELNSLIKEIEQQESFPDLKVYAQLQKSISGVKNAASNAFAKLKDFKIQTQDPDTAQDLQLAMKDVRNLFTGLNEDVKRTLIEERSIQNQIAQFSQEIHFFSEELQKQWFKFLDAKATKPSSPAASLSEEVKQHQLDVDRTIQSICQQHAEEIDELIAGIVNRWGIQKENLSATPAGNKNRNVLRAEIHLKQAICKNRQDLWETIAENNEVAGTDLRKINELQQSILQQQKVDELILKMFNQEQHPGFLTQITSVFSYLTTPLKPLFTWNPKTDLITTKEDYDIASLVFVEQAKVQLVDKIIDLIQELPVTPVRNELVARFHVPLLTEGEFKKTQLDAYVEALSSSYKNDKHISEAISRIRAEKEVLSLLIALQRNHNNLFAKNLKAQYSELFSDESMRHTSIYKFAAGCKNYIETCLTDDINLNDLPNEWQKARLYAADKIEPLDQLQPVTKLYKERLEANQEYEEKIKTLSGPEAELGKMYLSRLETLLNSLETNVSNMNGELLASFWTHFVTVDHNFNALFPAQNQKKSKIEKVNKEINDFVNSLAKYDAMIEQIEKIYEIDLISERDYLQSQKEKLTHSKINVLSTGLWAYISSDQKVEDISLDALETHAQNVEKEIRNTKTALNHYKLSEIIELIATFSKNLNTTKSKIPGLKGELQFYKSKVANDQLKALLANQKSLITNFPYPQYVYQHLTQDIKKLQEISDQAFNKNDSLQLLVQLKDLIKERVKAKKQYEAKQTIANKTKLDGDIQAAAEAKQNLDEIISLAEQARRGFFDLQKHKLANHAKIMTNQAEQFKKLPLLHQQTIDIIKRTKPLLDQKIKDLPAAIKAHFKTWSPLLDNATAPFNPDPNLPIESLTISEMQSYEAAIDLVLYASASHLANFKKAYEKAKNADKQFEMKMSEANDAVDKLDKNNQLLRREKLKKSITRFEEFNEDYRAEASPEKAQYRPRNQRSWLSLNSWLTPRHWVPEVPKILIPQILRSPERKADILPTNAYKLIEEYCRNVGQSITKIDGTIKRLKSLPEQDIPDQLATCKDPEIEKELKKRFNDFIQPKIGGLLTKLKNLVPNNELSHELQKYISPNTRLHDEVIKAVNEKIIAVEQLEKGYSKGILAWLKGTSTPLHELNPKQMKSHIRDLKQIQSAVTENIDETLFISEIAEADKSIEEMKTILLTNQVKKLKDKEFFTAAYQLEKDVSKASSNVNAWKVHKQWTWIGRADKQKAASFDDLKRLKADLEKSKDKIADSIAEAKAITKGPSREEQLKTLIRDQKQLESLLLPSNKEKIQLRDITDDIATLKTNIIAKATKDVDNHQKYLKDMKEGIEKIYSKYLIEFISRKDLDKILNSEIKKFVAGDYQLEIYNPTLGIFSGPTKRIGELNEMDILNLSPDLQVAQSIARSKKTVLQTLDYETFNTVQERYDEVLEKAKESKKDLLAKGEFFYAEELEKEIEKVEADDIHITYIYKKEEFEDLLDTLETLANELEKKEIEISSKTPMKIADQIAKISPEKKEELASHLAKDLTKKIEQQKKAIDTSKEDVKKISTSLGGFPKEWKKEIFNALDTCKDKIDQSGRGLVTDGILWGTTFTPLRDLSVDELLIVDGNIKNEIKQYTTTVDKYNLKPVQEQLEFFQERMEVLEKTKAKWKKERYLDSVDKLDELVAKIKKELKTHFDNASKKPEDLPAQMLQMITVISNKTSDLIEGMEEISDNKPKSWGEIVQIRGDELEKAKAANPNSAECKVALKKYNEAKAEFRTETKTQIETHVKDVDEYFKLIDSISKKAQAALKADIPAMWKHNTQKYIKQKTDQLNNLVQGLPTVDANGITFKPFDKLNQKELEAYGKLVNGIAEKDEEAKTNPRSMLGDMKQLLNFDQIKSHLDKFHQSSKDFSKAIENPNTPKTTKLYLEAALEANRTLLKTALKDMTEPHDIKAFSQTLGQVQAALQQTWQEKNERENAFVGENKVDPWTYVLRYEKMIKARLDITQQDRLYLDGSFNQIRGGYFTPLPQNQPPHEVKGLVSVPVTAKELLGTEADQTTALLNKLIDKGLAPNSPTAKIISLFKNSTVPDLQSKLTLLGNGSSKIKASSIKQFADMLEYKKEIDHATSQAEGAKAQFNNDNTIFWFKQLANVEQPDVADYDLGPAPVVNVPAAQGAVPVAVAVGPVNPQQARPAVVRPVPLLQDVEGNVPGGMLIINWVQLVDRLLAIADLAPEKTTPIKNLPADSAFIRIWNKADVFIRKKRLEQEIALSYRTYVNGLKNIPRNFKDLLKDEFDKAIDIMLSKVGETPQNAHLEIENKYSDDTIEIISTKLQNAKARLHAVHELYEKSAILTNQANRLLTDIEQKPNVFLNQKVFLKQKDKLIADIKTQLNSVKENANTPNSSEDIETKKQHLIKLSKDLESINLTYNQTHVTCINVIDLVYSNPSLFSNIILSPSDLANLIDKHLKNPNFEVNNLFVSLKELHSFIFEANQIVQNPKILNNWQAALVNYLNNLDQPNSKSIWDQLCSDIFQTKGLVEEVRNDIDTFSQKYTHILTHVKKITGKDFSTTFTADATIQQLTNAIPNLPHDKLVDYKEKVKKELKGIESLLGFDRILKAIESYEAIKADIIAARDQSRKEGAYSKAQSLTNDALTPAEQAARGSTLEQLLRKHTNMELPGANYENFNDMSSRIEKVTADLKKNFDQVLGKPHKETDAVTFMQKVSLADPEHQKIRSSTIEKIKADIVLVDKNYVSIEDILKKQPGLFSKDLTDSINNRLKLFNSQLEEIDPSQPVTIKLGLPPYHESPIEQLTVEEFLDYRASALHTLSEIQNEIQPILKACKTLSTFGQQIESSKVKTQKAVSDLKDLTQRKIRNYYYEKKIFYSQAKLIVAGNQLKEFAKTNVPLSTFTKMTKEFEEILEVHDNILKKVPQDPVKVIAQIKLASKDKDPRVKFVAVDPIFQYIKNTTDKRITDAIEKVEALKGQLDSFNEPKIKRRFLNIINEKVAELKALQKQDAQMAALSPEELSAWLGNVMGLSDASRDNSRNTDKEIPANASVDEILRKFRELMKSPEMAKELNHLERTKAQLEELKGQGNDLRGWITRVNKVVNLVSNKANNKSSQSISIDKFIAELQLVGRNKLYADYQGLLANPGYAGTIKSEAEAAYNALLNKLVSLDNFWFEFRHLSNNLNAKLGSPNAMFFNNNNQP